MVNSKSSTIITLQNFKFIMISVWIDWGTLRDGKILKKQFAAIALKNLTAGTHIIHPLSDFILNYWQARKFNTQKKHALNTVKFLNYILFNRLNIRSLSDLNFKNGNNYLNSLTSEGQSRGSVKDSERTLTYLYLWLIDKGISNLDKNRFIKKETQNGSSYYESPFQVIYPDHKPPNVEHTLPIRYIPLLIEIAILVARPITLGVYLQLFGGLRVGEVVNLKRTQLKRRIANGDFLFEVKDQNFRTDLKDSSGGNYVKRSRNQRVFQINDWGESLFNDHIELFTAAGKTPALFVNRDGKAMSGRSYRQYFDKLKRCFIQYLKTYGDSDDKLVAHHLSMMSWSTHIGRGTFTNMLAEIAENPYDIAFPRGDKNLLSSLSYMSRTERLRKKLEDKFHNMHGTYIPKLIEKRNT
ncbi:hypothetical protein SAMN03159341_1379 [Paenibacillus sp. 1_12]|uniref:hypothetical protein n=1 Tax=Paenibacillus sp. 1_12 TaxID=1566278 RepID=UPI0008E07F7A|nr:hypothetical protein [Paenibacillus sp. 1_12]SFM48189.1 hypothetical protein SAMN03159341_1379 [Paenibacillus sp. 1_12]